VVFDKDVDEAVAKLLELPGLKKSLEHIKNPQSKQHFIEHLAQYVAIWLPDCPWEVTTTNRYTISTFEASVTARQYIRKGADISYLVGRKLLISEQKEAALKAAGRNFSIIQSERSGKRSLFLGPARFANHDCDPNARLAVQGENHVKLVAIKDIKIGEEITVTYADAYFGEENCECLCQTCETGRVNGWANPAYPPLSMPPTESRNGRKDHTSQETTESELKGYGLRKRSRTFSPNEYTEMVTKRQKSSKSVSKIASRAASRPSSRAASVAARVDVVTQVTVVGASEMLKATELEISTQLQVKTEDTEEHNISAAIPDVSQEPEVTQIPRKPRLSPHRPSFVQKRAISDESDHIGGNVLLRPSLQSASSNSSASTPAESIFEEAVVPSTEAIPPAAETDMTDLSEFEVDESSKTAVRVSTSTSRAPTEPLGPGGKRLRVPGDYINNRALLTNSYAAWIDCTVCSGRFIQENAYEPRVACQRCERHLKLYGFQWPKTDYENPLDNEYRVMDYREVCTYRKRKADELDATAGAEIAEPPPPEIRRTKKVKRDSNPPEAIVAQAKAPVKGGLWKGWVDPVIAAAQYRMKKKGNPRSNNQTKDTKKTKKDLKSKVKKTMTVNSKRKTKKVTKPTKVTSKTSTKPIGIIKVQAKEVLSISSRGRKIMSRSLLDEE
jgi:histone-lysine N-methyltransferase SUV420H